MLIRTPRIWATRGPARAYTPRDGAQKVRGRDEAQTCLGSLECAGARGRKRRRWLREIRALVDPASSVPADVMGDRGTNARRGLRRVQEVWRLGRGYEEFGGSSMLMLSEPLVRCGLRRTLGVPAALLRGVPEPPIPHQTGCHKMVVEAVVVGIDGSCPEAPGWVTITYQLSKTEHTTRDGKLEMARLENEAALGVKLCVRARSSADRAAGEQWYPPSRRRRPVSMASSRTSVMASTSWRSKDPDATFQPHVNDAVAQRTRDMGAGSSELPADDGDEDFETAMSARMAAMAATEHDAGCDDGVWSRSSKKSRCHRWSPTPRWAMTSRR